MRLKRDVPLYQSIQLSSSEIIEVRDWFNHAWSGRTRPLMGSVDVRDAGFKVASVDANAFPAGFHHIHPDDYERCMSGLAEWLDTNAPNAETICLVPEPLTRNPSYIQNVMGLQSLITETGRSLSLAVPEVELVNQEIQSSDGSVSYGLLSVEQGRPFVNGEAMDLCILNRDVSNGALLRLSSEHQAIRSEMGWHNRRKSTHQAILDEIVTQFSSDFNIDPWLISPLWAFSGEKCLAQDSCLELMADSVDQILADVQAKYDYYGLAKSPSVFVKNDRGTYGLGIITVTAGSDLVGMSKRRLGRLTYGRGGQEVEDFVLQEGVPTALRMGGGVAESVLYCTNGVASGCFLRLNRKRSDEANLNTPSSEFVPTGLAWSSFNIHAIIAELSMLAMADEAVAYSSSIPTIS